MKKYITLFLLCIFMLIPAMAYADSIEPVEINSGKSVEVVSENGEYYKFICEGQSETGEYKIESTGDITVFLDDEEIPPTGNKGSYYRLVNGNTYLIHYTGEPGSLSIDADHNQHQFVASSTNKILGNGTSRLRQYKYRCACGAGYDFSVKCGIKESYTGSRIEIFNDGFNLVWDDDDAWGTDLPQGEVPATDICKAKYANNVKVGNSAKISFVFLDSFSEWIGKNGRFTYSCKIVPRKPVVSTAVSKGTKLTVKMSSKVSSTGGSKYQLAYREKGKSTWKYVTTTNQSKTITSLKSGKTYQVKVRAKKTVDGKTYSSEWSTVKTSDILY